MKERPILFSAPMVRALLNCTKSQTRRVVKPQHIKNAYPSLDAAIERSPSLAAAFCPHGQPGDRLWVRESGWERPERTAKMMREGADTWPRFAYAADGWNEQDRTDFKVWGFKPRPSIHMPRWASRILLEITGVRVERLQDISQDDAKAEGAPPSHPSIDRVSAEFGYSDFSRSWYAQLWEQINGPGSWDANPWVWVVEFKRVMP